MILKGQSWNVFGFKFELFVICSEGSDVYLECRVDSRPRTDNIVWMKEVMVMVMMHAADK